MRIAAVADVHAPRYLDLLNRALESSGLGDASLLVMAGDMIDKGKVRYFAQVYERVRRHFKGPIVGVFGNEEYDEVKPELRRYDVVWLDDEVYRVEVGGVRLSIVGTRGSLDSPTTWQAKHIPGIEEIYRARVERVRSLLREARRGSDLVVLVTHYAPRCGTLVGEDPRIWRFLASSAMGEVVREEQPEIVIHGHVHKGSVPTCRLGRSTVYNVSIPARGGITVIEVGPTEADITRWF